MNKEPVLKALYRCPECKVTWVSRPSKHLCANGEERKRRAVNWQYCLDGKILFAEDAGEESQDELWDELRRIINDSPTDEYLYTKTLAKLKSKYTIKKRS